MNKNLYSQWPAHPARYSTDTPQCLFFKTLITRVLFAYFNTPSGIIHTLKWMKRWPFAVFDQIAALLFVNFYFQDIRPSRTLAFQQGSIFTV